MPSGKKRRRFKRYRHKSGFHLSIGSNSIEANTTDFSLGGVGFLVENTPSLTPGSIVNLKIEDLNLDIEAKIVWSYKSDKHCRIGIERKLISGFLRHYSLPDILLDLQRSEKNGMFEIRNNSISKRIYIKNGDMVFATSNLKEDRLGETLLKSGKINLEQYNKSVDVMRKTGKRHGSVIVELGYINPETLIWAVRHQVEEIILSLFKWEDGEFVLIEGPLLSNEVITLKLSAANLIYRGIKRINNFAYIKSATPSMDTILHYSADPINLFQEISLDKTDKDILSLIDGKRNIKDILSISPLDNFQTLKTLYALTSARIIETKEKETEKDETLENIIQESKTEVDSVFIEKVEAFFNRLKFIDYYEILGLEKWATHDDIRKAYYTVAKDFHPDKHFYMPSETLKNKLNTIFTQITEAYKILSSSKMRKEYDDSLSTRVEKRAPSNLEIAKTRFREGREAFMKRSYTEAAVLFGQAAYLDSSG